VDGNAHSSPRAGQIRLRSLGSDPGQDPADIGRISYPSDLAESLGVSRQSTSNHLTCLRGCGLVVAVPDGRKTRYELADARLGHALKDLLGLVLAVDPACCAPDGECLG
jgi:DNA-binding transcriptional ArsR family regulator